MGSKKEVVRLRVKKKDLGSEVVLKMINDTILRENARKMRLRRKKPSNGADKKGRFLNMQQNPGEQIQVISLPSDPQSKPVRPGKNFRKISNILKPLN